MSLTVADTAYSIAAVRAEERVLFDDPYAKHFVAAGAHADEGTQRYLALPFFRDGIRLRTRYIDDAVRAALRDGFGQVVLLGAGFDARALRMPELAEAPVYEIDAREQLARKKDVLARAGVAIPNNDVYVPVDFGTDDLGGALATAGFDRERAGVFVWEGVIGYIDEATIDASLRFMADAAKRVRVVFTFGAGTFPEGTRARVAKLGFAVLEELGLDAVWPRYLPGESDPSAAYSKIGVLERA